MANSVKGLLGAALAAGLVMLVLGMNGFSVERHEATLLDRPTGHAYHAMIYDSHSRRILLFGGQTGDIFTQSSDTWAYDPAGKLWQKLNPPESPPALAAHAMAYEPLGDKTVLYGGVIMTEDKAARLFRQTWIFDYGKKTWKRASDGPPERYGHRMIAIAKSGVIILFGGADVDSASKNNARKLKDTWIYEAMKDQWKEMRPSLSPSPRHYYGMVYDSKADRVIVWGGAQEGSPDETSVWAYNFMENTWTERKPASSPELLHHVAMAYDSRINKTVLYGGNSEGSDETWIYDYAANTWTRRYPETNPGRLSRMPIVYVPGLNRTFLLGGQLDKREFVYSGETWLYDGEANAWENAAVRLME